MECLKTERSQIKYLKTVDALDIFKLIPGTNNPLPISRNVKEIYSLMRREGNMSKGKQKNNFKFNVGLDILNKYNKNSNQWE